MISNHDTIFGKRILVGLTYIDHAGEVSRQIQLHGLISSVTESSLYFEKSDGSGEFSIPFDGTLETAEPGATYTLRVSGEEVSDVDFLASWTIHSNPATRSDL